MFYIPYHSTENVCRMFTKVNMYKYCTHVLYTMYHKSILHVGSPELLLQGDTIHVLIGKSVFLVIVRVLSRNVDTHIYL